MSAGDDSAGLGETAYYGQGSWIGSFVLEPQDGDDHSADPTDTLLEHPAVYYHGRGIMSEHLADFIDRMAERTMDRVLGIGDESYGTREGQAFEKYDMNRQYEELLDELADAIAYIAFIAIKAGVAVRSTNA